MKKVFSFLFMLPAFVGMMLACSAKVTDAKELQGKWNIVEVNGEKVSVEEPPFFEFDMKAGKLHGNAGCNIVNSSLVLDEKDASAVSFAQAISTMMACPNMDLESNVLKSMEKVRSVKAGKDANEMNLVDEAGNVLFVLARK